jgi:hypothetical protein
MMNSGRETMSLVRVRAAACAVALGLFASAGAFRAQASIEDYEFQLVESQVKQSDAAEIAVRLIDKRTGKSVPDAVIFAQRVDMAPEGMETMRGPIELLPSTEPGVYRFKANLLMEGGWRLSLAAKVQGETGTLESKLEFKAAP